MRLGIQAKQIAAVTAIVGLAVVALSAVHVTRLARVVLHESDARGQLLANAILHRAREVVPGSADPYAALRSDPGLRAVLESSIYGENVTDAAIIDTHGVTIAASDPALEGQPMPMRADLKTLVDAGPIDQLQGIYSQEGRTLEVREQMLLGDEAFGSIRIGVSTVLMRQELNASLRPALNIALASLLIAVIVAALLAQLFLRPINVIRSGLTRLGKGEFGVTLDLPQDDEFGELGTFFNTVSQQLSADRSLLAGQKANLQSAVEHLEDAVALFNPSGELLFSNPAMQPTLPADAIGRALRALLPDGDPYRTIVEETLATRKSRGPIQLSGFASSNPESRIPNPDSPGPESRIPDPDSERLVMTHAIEGTDGELVGVLLVSRNLSYLSRMQSTIAYSRKLTALGRLTAGVAHEVKNPLNAMMIHLELLRTKIRKGMTPTMEPVPVAAGGLGLAEARPSTGAADAALAHVEVIAGEIRRLDEVVQGFLKFSRPEDLRLQPVRVTSIFDEILPLIAAEAAANEVAANKVKVEVDAPNTQLEVNGDASMLRQAFLNLAINACQAMPTGGTLRLSCAAVGRDRVEVRIEDTGIGIPAADLDKIFDLYFTTKDHGTGIGLSMVYRIIQLHDGEIEVQSTPDRGTTFRVLLPRANEI